MKTFICFEHRFFPPAAAGQRKKKTKQKISFNGKRSFLLSTVFFLPPRRAGERKKQNRKIMEKLLSKKHYNSKPILGFN
jgi:hypothetical protein